ncbi:MAB_1171c family putative transporter [Streptomyces sp. NPDC052811]|uniref:MAB_1171c family putative transporter n=1 Tax=Streptomyces sp. NPDC052811 TaxID=3155731 RepID=UPI0034265B69
MQSQDYYIPAAAMGAALTFKVPSLVRSWRDPLLRAVCALLAMAGLVFFFAAPSTIAEVNRLTGIPNFSAPLVYSLLSAFSASCLVLIVNWRGGPAEQTRRVSRRWIIAYSLEVVVIVVLFALGSTPVERLRDLDTYYANTPFIREMIVLYLVALTVAGVSMNVMCWRWALQVRGWLRTGLLIIVLGYLFNLAYLVTKFTAVFARWGGHDLDFLSSDVAPSLASWGAQISAVGFCLPLVCQRFADSWSTWSTYRRLEPLWRTLRAVAPRQDRSVHISWWSSAELRLTQRESDIHDAMLGLYPYFDTHVRTRAYEAAVAAGRAGALADAEADAAMVTAAVRARAADPLGKIINSAGTSGSTPPEGPRDLVRMSVFLRQSPVVTAARGPASARSESDSHERTR